MKIVCPDCKAEREIEHTSAQCNIQCVCGVKFPLNQDCILEEYSEIDCLLPEYIGKYKILELIGFGGMGKIYKALHPDLKIPVALKLLKSEFASDERACGRFIRSAKICARISHPNVIRVYDCNYSEENGLYLVMEYINGGSAQELLDKDEKLSVEEAVRIARGVCTGLMEAETRKIVHRDIKPENIMFDANGTIKILDLGLAKIGDTKINDETRFAETIMNTSLGTAEYMSPEQALDAKSCDCRSDIYSLGATMYHLLTGKYPFGSGDAAELKKRHAFDELLPPSSCNSLIPPQLDQIIIKCMAKNRSLRYQSAAELYNDLLAFQEGATLLPSFQIPKQQKLSLFARWEQAFNAPIYQKFPSWELLPADLSFLSPFRIFLLLIIMAFTAGLSAYLTTPSAQEILPVDLLLLMEE